MSELRTTARMMKVIINFLIPSYGTGKLVLVRSGIIHIPYTMFIGMLLSFSRYPRSRSRFLDPPANLFFVCLVL